MKNQFELFNDLHHQSEPLLIGNVWNAQSAKVFENQKFKAIATSSSAVAETLGYADGEQMSFEEYLFVIQHIRKAVDLPLSVDLEWGYGKNSTDIAKNIKRLSESGISGINIEDSIITNGKRSLVDAIAFKKTLEAIHQHLTFSGIKMFINVRCDTFLLNVPNPVEESTKRLKVYQQTGVQGLFFPCITNLSDIKMLAQNSKLPLSVMCMPGLPDFKQLQEAGVKRISMGNFLNHSIYNQLDKNVATIIEQGKFASLF